MITPPPLPNENERLVALYRYNILDTEAESDFDDLVEITAELCGVEIALISLIDSDRQWFKACTGLDATETHRDISFCGHAIHDNDIFEISDATQDLRFHDNPLVVGAPHIRFYAGRPLRTPDGHNIGTLCLVDAKPRSLTPQQRKLLNFLASQVEQKLSLRRKNELLSQGLQAIQTQANLLASGNDLRDHILGVLAHDLRSPVASLEGILNAFDQDYLDPELFRELIECLRPNLQKNVEQLNKVLHWAHQQVSQGSEDVQSCALADIATESRAWVLHCAQKKGIEIVLELEELPLYALGNPEYVHIVWRNLLSNGVKYSKMGDRVTVFARRDGDRISLGVRDQGLGISEHMVNQLLSRKNTVSTLGTDDEMGTGLGLLLCHTYLLKMNSQLEIESHLGQGSAFYFQLPIATPA